MSVQKPTPLFAAPTRRHCPVCGEVSYSRAGVHPQCAQTEADARRIARLKARKRVAPKTAQPAEARSWHRPCPKCRAQVHLRKMVCACGHRFAARPPASAGRS